MERLKILFVDDEKSILATTPLILTLHGFEVTACSNVGDALQAINSKHFDILLSDLNIGEPGDGFMIVSAMKRIQPHVKTIIVTGYPDFKTALNAIHNQVDDYVTKPTDVRSLLSMIKNHIKEPSMRRAVLNLKISYVLKENKEKIIESWIDMMEGDSLLGSLSLTRADRAGLIHETFDRLIASLKGKSEPEDEYLPAQKRGQLRKGQGYKASMMVEESRLLQIVIFSTLQENLIDLDLSLLIPDLIRIADFIQERLRISIETYENLAAG